MKIDKAAYPFIAAAAAPTLLAAVAGKRKIALGLGALTAGVTAFFRDPNRFPDLDLEVASDIIVAPADGKVMHAGPPQPGAAPPGEWQQIAIFLNLADVHINRTPYGGKVKSVTYRPGRYLAAFKEASATENESSEITIERDVDGRRRVIVFRQIVGLLARRVVTRVAPGDVVKTGQRIGLMKFGSRMDVFVPTDVPLLVAKGDRVVAGETALGRWPEPAGDR